MADSAGTSKPRRIKALLTSFLKGVSREEKCHKESENLKEDADAVDSGNGNSDFVVIDEWPQPSSEKGAQTVQPLNQESFFKRVETFTTSTWFAKPLAVSPLQCARFGWENIDVDSLKCVSCKEVLYGGLPPKWEQDTYKNACVKLQESLKSSHSKICPWASNPSPALFLEVPLLNHREAVDAFLDRVLALSNFKTSSLPQVDKSPLEQVDMEESDVTALLSRLTSEGLKEQETRDRVERFALLGLLALCGWSRSSTEQPMCPVMTCHFCRRHIGLWNFKAFEGSQDEGEQAVPDSSDEPEPSPKRMKFQIEKQPFNPVAEHRNWCPWTKPTSSTYTIPLSSRSSQENKDTTCRIAWQELLFILQKRTSPEKNPSTGPLTDKATTPPSQAWKVVRRITNFWQSKVSTQKS